jgi:hypothetical protein
MVFAGARGSPVDIAAPFRHDRLKMRFLRCLGPGTSNIVEHALRKQWLPRRSLSRRN